MREIRVHGQSGRYQHTRIGVGGRMDTLQCAVLLAKLERFDWEVERRIALGRRYDELLARHAPTVQPITVKRDRTSVYGQYTVRVADRARVQDHLRSRGIPTAVHYPQSVHQQPAYAAAYRGQSFPAAQKLGGEVLSLPMSADLTDADQDLVVASISEVMRVSA
jgi:UDP-2-acetamido-2-deoxy-ribo-hexuluronate aminotransferase